jgi:uncharacterized protein
MGRTRIWRPSRFNSYVRDPDGKLLVFNSYASALLQFEGGTADRVEAVLTGALGARGEMRTFLARQGVLVRSDTDELGQAEALHEQLFSADDRLGLTLLAHENCNFRCVYCYEEFKKKRMSDEVADGVVELVRKRADQLRYLTIGWFGGEPLLAFDLIEDVCQRVRAICAEHGIAFMSQMTTNGFLLDADRAARCIAAGVVRYTVTLDGPARTHDRMRVLANGGPSFDRILANLRHLRDHAHGFQVQIRVNFSPDNLPAMPEFVRFLGRELGNDERFTVMFRPVGKWGGPKDAGLSVCDHHSGIEQEIELAELAMTEGFGLDTWKRGMKPFGNVCYAASPRHFVIGSDGIVYKCTVAFNDPRNHVGRLHADGTLELRGELVDLWTRSGEEKDADCRACGFRPACQGNLCPLERLDARDKRCPTQKTHMQQILPLLARDARRALPVVR